MQIYPVDVAHKLVSELVALIFPLPWCIWSLFGQLDCLILGIDVVQTHITQVYYCHISRASFGLCVNLLWVNFQGLFWSWPDYNKNSPVTSLTTRMGRGLSIYPPQTVCCCC